VPRYGAAMDPIAQFKETAKQNWSNFGALEMWTASAAPRLVRHAGIASGMQVLDVACGTGVVALTAARLGAKVTGVDLTPKLIERARENASIMGLDVQFVENDVEALPFGDAVFDVVVSQFGHMFAPRPEMAISEMLRVLKPGGTIAFSTWPPELYIGRSFALMSKYGPPVPPGIAAPPAWGDPNVVRERLGAAVKDIVFARDNMPFPTLSVAHMRLYMEQNLGPVVRIVQTLETEDPPKLAAFRKELEALIANYFENNFVRQDYLMTRATKL
jgi:ubiquinone/menaquinone biosynthesis C-methylase UbiE